MKYSIEKINLIKEEINYDDYINDEIKSKINKLIQQVNLKTNKPIFNRNKNKFWKQKNITEIKSFGDNIKNILNKLSDKTYENTLDKLKNLINIESNNSKENILLIYKNIFTFIFTNALSNKLYIDINIKLFKQLLDEYKINNDVYLIIIKDFIKLYDDYSYIDSNDDYTNYCKINLENTKRKNLTLLLYNLLNLKLIDINIIENIIETTETILFKFINNNEKKNIVNEIVENIYLLYYNYNTLTIQDKNNKLFDDKINNIKNIIDDEENYFGLSNKSIFKLEDLIGDVEN